MASAIIRDPFGSAAPENSRKMPRPVAYDEDFAAWSKEQAQHLRDGRLDLLDLSHLAEEFETSAKILPIT